LQDVSSWLALVLLLLGGTDAARPADAGGRSDARPAGDAGAGAAAPGPDRRWSKLRRPAPGPARAIGSYSNGCLQGAVALPPTGPGFEVLHLQRYRRYGHPLLVQYVRRLAATVKRQKLGMLLVGDLAQPRGGPTLTGHRSHQSGLDVDIGYAHPPWLLQRRLKAAERETLFPPAVVDLAKRALNPTWNPKIPRILEAAARDPAVDRIFVHAAIKRTLCTTGKTRPEWLRTLRPWWGHHDHFHVRLKCPPGDSDCQSQDPLPAGDGCDALDWWFTDDSSRARTERQGQAAAAPPPSLPAACQSIAQ
jgi:penicillin-insensitive murein endopeptidase